MTYIILSPKQNQPPRTETHLSLHVDSLPRDDQDAHLKTLNDNQNTTNFKLSDPN